MEKSDEELLEMLCIFFLFSFHQLAIVIFLAQGVRDIVFKTIKLIPIEKKNQVLFYGQLLRPQKTGG